MQLQWNTTWMAKVSFRHLSHLHNTAGTTCSQSIISHTHTYQLQLCHSLPPLAMYQATEICSRPKFSAHYKEASSWGNKYQWIWDRPYIKIRYQKTSMPDSPLPPFLPKTGYIYTHAIRHTHISLFSSFTIKWLSCTYMHAVLSFKKKKIVEGRVFFNSCRLH